MSLPLDQLTRRILARHVEEAARSGAMFAALAIMFPCGWSVVLSRAGLVGISGVATPKGEPVQAHGKDPATAPRNVHTAFVERYLQ